MKLYSLLLLAHLLGVIVWVGGMIVMHFAVRPAVLAQLAPAQRAPLLAEVLERFFAWVLVAVVLVLASGLAMLWDAGGMRGQHASVHLMALLGLVMAAVYAYIRWRPFRALQLAVAAQDLQSAAVALDLIRQLVVFNLGLGLATTAVAVVGRAF